MRFRTDCCMVTKNNVFSHVIEFRHQEFDSLEKAVHWIKTWSNTNHLINFTEDGRIDAIKDETTYSFYIECFGLVGYEEITRFTKVTINTVCEGEENE